MPTLVANAASSDVVAGVGMLAAFAPLIAVESVLEVVAGEGALPVREAGQTLALAGLRVAVGLSGHAWTLEAAQVAVVAPAARAVAKQPLPAHDQSPSCAVLWRENLYS